MIELKKLIRIYNTLASNEAVIELPQVEEVGFSKIHPSLYDYSGSGKFKNELKLLLTMIEPLAKKDLEKNHSEILKIQKLKEKLVLIIEKYYKIYYKKDLFLTLTSDEEVSILEDYVKELSDPKITNIYEKVLKLEQEYKKKQEKEIEKLASLGTDELDALIEFHTVNIVKIITKENEMIEERRVFDDMDLGKKLLEAKLICEKKQIR